MPVYVNTFFEERVEQLFNLAATVEKAVLQAISLDALARMSLRVRSAGGTLTDIDDSDWDDLPDLGAAFTAEAAWRHEVARLGDQPS